MPMDRSMLPELPGKPDWYIENAPKAVERIPTLDDTPVRAANMPAQSEPGLTPSGSPLEAPQFPTVGTQSEGERKVGKVKALAGKFRH